MHLSTSDEADNLKLALEYAATGYLIVRVYGIRDGKCLCHKRDKCSSPGKHPVGRDWQKNATIDERIIRTWFAERPDYNVGIVTGIESGIFVVDVDPRNGGNDSLRDLMGMPGGDWRATPTQITGGNGLHLVFRHTGGHVKTKAGVLPGIDLRGDGGMIVVEPSVHFTGGVYHWMEGLSLLDAVPADFPEQLRHSPHFEGLFSDTDVVVREVSPRAPRTTHLLPMTTQAVVEGHIRPRWSCRMIKLT